MQSLILKGQGNGSGMEPGQKAIERRPPNSSCGLSIDKSSQPSWPQREKVRRKSEGSVLWLHSSFSCWYLASILHWPTPGRRQKATASLDSIYTGQPPRHRAGLRIDEEEQTKKYPAQVSWSQGFCSNQTLPIISCFSISRPWDPELLREPHYNCTLPSTIPEPQWKFSWLTIAALNL